MPANIIFEPIFEDFTKNGFVIIGKEIFVFSRFHNFFL